MEDNKQVEYLESDGVFTVPVQLRVADKFDLSVTRKRLRYGLPYWVRSCETGAFDNKASILNTDTDVAELAVRLDQKMIYVPINWIEDYDV